MRVTVDRSCYEISIFFLSMVKQSLVGQDLLNVEVSRSHLDTSHSVGLLWTGDKPDTETSYLKTHSRDRHPCLGWDSNPQSQQESGRRQTP
jgi:hypothetical protein